MVNEKNLAKGLIISAAIIGGSILISGALGFLSHFIHGHKKPHHPHENNTCCERRIPNENKHFNKDCKKPHCDMKKHEHSPEFKGKEEKEESKPQENQKAPENKPKSNA